MKASMGFSIFDFGFSTVGTAGRVGAMKAQWFS